MTLTDFKLATWLGNNGVITGAYKAVQMASLGMNDDNYEEAISGMIKGVVDIIISEVGKDKEVTTLFIGVSDDFTSNLALAIVFMALNDDSDDCESEIEKMVKESFRKVKGE